MGTILTSYGDASYGHEGYAAQVRDDGTLTGAYIDETTPRMVGQVVAACDCGWTGTTRYPCPQPFDEQAHELALAEWEHDHARPVLTRMQQIELSVLRAGLLDLCTGADDLIAAQSTLARAARLATMLRRLRRVTEIAEQLYLQAQEQAEREHPQTTAGPGPTTDSARPGGHHPPSTEKE